MTATPDSLATEAKVRLREAAGELEKVAAGEGAAGTSLKSIGTNLRQAADDPASTNFARFARDVARAIHQVNEWQERRFGVPTPLQKPDRNRGRLDGIIDKLAAVHERAIWRRRNCWRRRSQSPSAAPIRLTAA